MTDTAIAFENLSKTYPKTARPAVAGINLAVRQGEILALVGESGSGKTTLLRMAAGLERPDSGTVHINGRVVSSSTSWVPPERRAVGLVFQEGALFPHRTVAANIGYGLRGTARTERMNTIARMLDLVGLHGFEERYPHELSGGERQRVALARALAPQPEVVLLDEPFSSLDTTLRQSLRDEVCRILRELRATAVLVVHDPEDALTAGDRVAVLKTGELEQVGTPPDVYRDPVNEYCARLFGPVNLVPGPDETTVFARPEHFSLMSEGAADGFDVDVIHVKDVGRHHEFLVRLRVKPSIEWLIRDDPTWPVRIGDRAIAVWDRQPKPAIATPGPTQE